MKPVAPGSGRNIHERPGTNAILLDRPGCDLCHTSSLRVSDEYHVPL